MSRSGGSRPCAWEPFEKNEVRQWWESPDHNRYFMNALRAVIDLEPIPDTEGHRTGGVKAR